MLKTRGMMGRLLPSEASHNDQANIHTNAHVFFVLWSTALLGGGVRGSESCRSCLAGSMRSPPPIFFSPRLLTTRGKHGKCLGRMEAPSYWRLSLFLFIFWSGVMSVDGWYHGVYALELDGTERRWLGTLYCTVYETCLYPLVTSSASITKAIGTGGFGFSNVRSPVAVHDLRRPAPKT